MFDVAVWGTVAEWFAAVGTVGAVMTTLWLVRRRARESAQVVTTLFALRDGTLTHLKVEVRNAGERTIRIASIGLGFGEQTPRRRLPLFGKKKLRRSYAMFAPPFMELPARLEPGDDVIVFFDREQIADVTGWLRDSRDDVSDARLWVEARTALDAAFRVAVNPRAALIRVDAPNALPETAPGVSDANPE